MFRTRDFILIFTAVVFLLVAIGATVWNQNRIETIVSESLILAEVGEEEYTAEVFVPALISREERLASMRQKIADGGEIILSAPEPVIEEEPEEVAEGVAEVESPSVQKCPGYREFSGQWQVDGIKFDVIEGARIVYREKLSDSVPELDTNASGTSPSSAVERDILLQLAVRTSPMFSNSCLSTDVIGIAQDGSLIRNDEASLYGVFGSNTLIGYALDGFPIYGVSDIQGDNCGGQIVSGQYGYYLSDKRDVILNCFSAVPISL